MSGISLDTVGDLIQDARAMLGEDPTTASPQWTDAILLRILQSGIREIASMIGRRRKNHVWVKSYTFNTVVDQADYDLMSFALHDMVRPLNFLVDERPVTMTSRTRMHQYDDGSGNYWTSLKGKPNTAVRDGWWLLTLIPIPDAVYECKLYYSYIPKLKTDLAQRLPFTDEFVTVLLHYTDWKAYMMTVESQEGVIVLREKKNAYVERLKALMENIDSIEEQKRNLETSEQAYNYPRIIRRYR